MLRQPSHSFNTKRTRKISPHLFTKKLQKNRRIVVVRKEHPRSPPHAPGAGDLRHTAFALDLGDHRSRPTPDNSQFLQQSLVLPNKVCIQNSVAEITDKLTGNLPNISYRFA